MVENTLLEITVSCPWCGLGKTLADQSADIRISCSCNICGRFYSIDFQTMRVKRFKQKPHKTIIKK